MVRMCVCGGGGGRQWWWLELSSPRHALSLSLQLAQEDLCPSALPGAIGGIDRPEWSNSEYKILLSPDVGSYFLLFSPPYPAFHPTLNYTCKMLLGASSSFPSSLTQL